MEEESRAREEKRREGGGLDLYNYEKYNCIRKYVWKPFLKRITILFSVPVRFLYLTMISTELTTHLRKRRDTSHTPIMTALHFSGV